MGNGQGTEELIKGAEETIKDANPEIIEGAGTL